MFVQNTHLSCYFPLSLCDTLTHTQSVLVFCIRPDNDLFYPPGAGGPSHMAPNGGVPRGFPGGPRRGGGGGMGGFPRGFPGGGGGFY